MIPTGQLEIGNTLKYNKTKSYLIKMDYFYTIYVSLYFFNLQNYTFYYDWTYLSCFFEGALSGLRQFLTTESPLKM